MNFSIEEVDGITIIASLPKVIDASNAMDFKADINQALGSARKVAIDMREVKFIDSAGCGALINLLRHLANQGGSLKLYDVQKQVRLVFELVRLHKIIAICNTRQEALLAFSHNSQPAPHDD